MFPRRVCLLLAAIGMLAACGDATADGGRNTSPAVIPVGSLPPTFLPLPAPAPTTATTTTLPRTTVPLDEAAQVGSLVSGNRVIMLGDSVMASTSKRYTNDMCDALVPLGWQVEVDAETGRFIEFGGTVLDARLSAGWDAAVIFLGNNFTGDIESYDRQLSRLVERLAPRPVVLLTVSEFNESRVKVNEVIFGMPARYPNVLVLDWAAVTAANPDLTGGDNLHLTNSGRAALAAEVAGVMGLSPVQPGKCLPTQFDDDTSGSVEGTTTTTAAAPPRTTKPTTPASSSSTTAPPTTAGTTTSESAGTTTTTTTT